MTGQAADIALWSLLVLKPKTTTCIITRNKDRPCITSGLERQRQTVGETDKQTSTQIDKQRALKELRKKLRRVALSSNKDYIIWKNSNDVFALMYTNCFVLSTKSTWN